MPVFHFESGIICDYTGARFLANKGFYAIITAYVRILNDVQK